MEDLGVPFFFLETQHIDGEFGDTVSGQAHFIDFPSMNFLAKLMWSKCYESYLTNLKKTP